MSLTRLANIRAFNHALCDALGLDPDKVRAITVTAGYETLPLVTVARVVTEGEAALMTELFRRYRLEPLTDETEP